MIALLSACTAPHILAPVDFRAAKLNDDVFLTRDGLWLPVRRWLPGAPPRAVIVALHGFNDYSAFFETPATYFQARGIASYAYDQRGFGAAPYRGRWFATERYLNDARDVINAVAQAHPNAPLYVLGNSMGGAVAIAMLAADDPQSVDGVILSAPAVWGRETMPWLQHKFLWLAAHTVPALSVTGRGLKIEPSDNHEMLRALGRDPLIIKETRIDAIWGLVDLMDRALASVPRLNTRALILYGARDEIITAGPTKRMIERLPGLSEGRQRLAVYQGGYHMLLRDLQAETVWRDIAHWIDAPDQPLPSGAGAYSMQFFKDR